MAPQSSFKPFPPILRSALKLKQREAAAAADAVRVPRFSKLARNAQAEVESIRDPAGLGAFRFTDQVASIALRARYHEKSSGAKVFERELLSQLIYNNPAIRFVVHYLYTRAWRLRHNLALERKAWASESAVPNLQARLASLSQGQDSRRRQQARDMGLSTLELENVEDVAGSAVDDQSTALNKQIERARQRAAKYRNLIMPVEPISGSQTMQGMAEHAREEAAKQREQFPSSTPLYAPEDRQMLVVGPTTPGDVVAAVRAGRKVDLPTEDALEVGYREAGRRPQIYKLRDYPTLPRLLELLEMIGGARLAARAEESTPSVLFDGAAVDSRLLYPQTAAAAHAANNHARHAAMPVANGRRATEGQASSSVQVPPSLLVSGSSASTPRAVELDGLPSRSGSPDSYAQPVKRYDRPRSSSFSSIAPSFVPQRRAIRHESDSLSATQRGLAMASLVGGAPSGRVTPVRSPSMRDMSGGPTSPSMVSIASAATTSTPRSLYDSRQIAAAIDKYEHAHKTDVRAGELGNVGAVGFGGDDHWQTVCVRVLPLWNGEGAKGFVEELNELVTLHIRRLIDRSPSNAIDYLTEHFMELLSTGMLTLNARLASLSDEQLLRRLEQVWVFFLTGVLPYLEAIFLPFSMDAALRALAAKRMASTEHTPRSSPIEVRRLALMAFRDHLLLPHASQLASAFHAASSGGARHAGGPQGRRSSIASLASGSTAMAGDTPRLSTSAGSNAALTSRRTQMLCLVASAQTDDEAQTTVESLLLALRGDRLSVDSRPISVASKRSYDDDFARIRRREQRSGIAGLDLNGFSFAELASPDKDADEPVAVD